VTTLVYLHGFRSSPQSIKARLLAGAVAALPAARRPRLEVPALAHEPARAVAAVAAWVRAEVTGGEALTFVGSSLGGFYATHLAEAFGARAVLINPAVRPYDDLAPYAGPQTNLYTGETFEVLPRHFDELRALAVPRITRPGRYLLLARSGDEVLDWRTMVAFYGGAWQQVRGGGTHGYDDIGPDLPAVLRFAGVPA
jgi:predicted esterase YcpF (UPF0227 family)